MAISDETLKAIIRDFHGFELSDAELALIRPELETTWRSWRSCGTWTYPGSCRPGFYTPAKGVSMTSGSDLLRLTIEELAPMVQRREVSPVEITQAALAQADRLQPILNSFITILGDQAMAQAKEQEAALAGGEYRGPLQGVPIGIKDNIATEGIRTTLGSKVLADYGPCFCPELSAVWFEQVSANAKATDWHLTAKEMEELESTLMATG